MNNKKYTRYALFAMMLLGVAQQTLPMTSNNPTKAFCRIVLSKPKKLSFRSLIKRSSKNINSLKTSIMSYSKGLYPDKVFHPNARLAKILPKIAPKVGKSFFKGFLKILGGRVSIALTVASGIYYLTKNRIEAAQNSGKKQLISSLEINSLGKYNVVSALAAAATIASSSALYLARNKIMNKVQTLIAANTKLKKPAVANVVINKEAKAIERTIAKAANMTVQELQAFVKGFY